MWSSHTLGVRHPCMKKEFFSICENPSYRYNSGTLVGSYCILLVSNYWFTIYVIYPVNYWCTLSPQTLIPNLFLKANKLDLCPILH